MPRPKIESTSDRLGLQQSLYNAVQAVAAQFPQGALRDKYTQAAKTFRAPYFDWASQPPQGTSAFPSAFTAPNVTVVDVDGKTKSTANPLYRFAFHPVNPSQGDFPAQVRRFPNSAFRPGPLTLHAVEPLPDDSPVPESLWSVAGCPHRAHPVE